MNKAIQSHLALVLAVVFSLAAGWVAGTLIPLPVQKSAPAAPAAHADPAAPAPVFSLLPSYASIPDVRQSTGYTCGAAALQAVLAYWGTSEREDRLAARLRSTPEAGTHPDEIIRVAREFGLTAELREGLDLSDLESALAAGTSVIVDLQAWRENTSIPWTETWDDGHYMVLLSTDAENLYFEDPSLLGPRGVIPRAEFVDRWHDYEGDPPLDPSDRKYIRMAMFFKGGRPAPSAPVPVERVY
jgi:predicted double-glycine peptidase